MIFCVANLKCPASPIPKIRTQNLKKGHVIVTMPFYGWFVILLLNLLWPTYGTKFEDSSFTHYKDMKEDLKRKTGVIWGC